MKEITINGETRNIAQWAKVYGLNEQTLYSRLNRYGWHVELAVTTPALWENRSRKKRKWYKVWNAQTGEFICEGASEQCAKAMGLKSRGTFFDAQTRCMWRNVRRRKYIIHSEDWPDSVPLPEKCGYGE